MENIENADLKIYDDIIMRMHEGDVDGAIELLKELDPREIDEVSGLLHGAYDSCNRNWQRLLHACVDLQPHDLAGEGWRRKTKAFETLERVKKNNRGYTVK